MLSTGINSFNIPAQVIFPCNSTKPFKFCGLVPYSEFFGQGGTIGFDMSEVFTMASWSIRLMNEDGTIRSDKSPTETSIYLMDTSPLHWNYGLVRENCYWDISVTYW